MMMRLLILLVMLLPTQAWAAVDWDDSFEYADNTAMYAVWNAQSCSFTVADQVFYPTTERFHTGSKSVKLVFTGNYNVPGHMPCYKDRNLNATTTGTLYARWWMYLDNFSHYPGTSAKITLHPTYNSDAYSTVWWGFPDGGLNPSAGMQRNWSPPGMGVGENIYGTRSIPQNTWVCVETRMTYATPGQQNGVLQMWVDGQESLNRSNVWMDQTGQQSVFRGVRMYVQLGYGAIFYDDYAVSRDARIGCGGSAPADTTAPGQVTGLAVASDTETSITYTWTARSESDMAAYVLQGCTGAACTNFAAVGTVNHPTTTFTWTGRTANTLYRMRVAARDTSGNTGTVSAIVDETTDAVTVLPTVTAFTTTATGGQITYTGTPTDFRIPFGGQNGDGTWWSSEIIRTLAQVSGGVLTFQWPLGTNYACAHARDAVAAEDAVAYRCTSVTPAAPGGTPTGTYLRKLSSNPRWLTLDGTTALYRVGISGGDNCNASFCGIQDLLSSNTAYGYVPLNLITSATITETFDGTASDIGTLWDAGYTSTNALTKVSGVVQATVSNQNSSESRSDYLYGNQFAKATLQTFTGAGASYLFPMVNMSAPGSVSGYECVAQRNAGGQTSKITRKDAGSVTTLVTESATTWASTDTIECKRVGKFIYLLRNNAVLLTAEDTTYRDGRVGLGFYAATPADATVTNFTGGPVVADFVAALDTLVTAGSNWVRYWTLEQSTWGSDANYAANQDITIPFDQFPWRWTGLTRADTSTGTSVNVGIYDLTELNQPFFDRVSARVDAALQRGITPIITMFSGGHLFYGLPTSYNAGFSNPFYSGNNQQNIACDTNANEACEELHTLANTTITFYQQQYINRLVQTLGDRPVILEVSNEDQTDSTLWQNMVMEQVRSAETLAGTNPHVIFQSGWWRSDTYPAGGASNTALFSNSRNDAVSPLCLSDGTNYETNPPYSDGTRLVIYDSDHIGYDATGCGTWTSIVPWKLFTRAIYPLFLSERETAPVQTAVKTAMAQTALYSTKINLATAYPETGTSVFSTGYGLFTGTNSTTPNCSEYIMLMPSDGSSTINLTACSGGSTFDVTYLNLTSGAESSGGTTTGGASRSFNPAGSDPMVVLLKLNSVADITAPVIISCVTSPAGVLPSGTTSVTITCITDENATVKMDPTFGTAYASMATTFSTTGTTSHSQSVGSLADNTSYTRYVRASDGTNATTTDYPVAWSVAAAAVSTVPADVTGVRGTLNEATGTILWQWDAVSGADRYMVEISADDAFLVAVDISSNTGTTYQQGTLTANSAYTTRVKAFNGANQESVNWGLSGAVNTSLPPQLTGLTETSPGAYSSTVILTWDAPTTNGVIAIAERCTGAACTDFALLSGASATGLTDSTVSASTVYCYRLKYSNIAYGGTSADWSSTYCATTKSVAATGTGLIQPRITVPYGVQRLPRN